MILKCFESSLCNFRINNSIERHLYNEIGGAYSPSCLEIGKYGKKWKQFRCCQRASEIIIWFVFHCVQFDIIVFSFKLLPKFCSTLALSSWSYYYSTFLSRNKSPCLWLIHLPIKRFQLLNSLSLLYCTHFTFISYSLLPFISKSSFSFFNLLVCIT